MRPLNKNFDPKLLFVLFIIFATIFYVLFSSQQDGLQNMFGSRRNVISDNLNQDVIAVEDYSWEQQYDTDEHKETINSDVVNQLKEDNEMNNRFEQDISEVLFLEPEILIGDDKLGQKDNTKDNTDERIVVPPKDIVVPEKPASKNTDSEYDESEVKSGNNINKVQFINSDNNDDKQVDENKFEKDVETGGESDSELLENPPKLPQEEAMKPQLTETEVQTPLKKDNLPITNENQKIADKVEEFMFAQEKELQKELGEIQADARNEYKNNPFFMILDSLLSNAEDKLLAEARRETKELMDQIKNKPEEKDLSQNNAIPDKAELIPQQEDLPRVELLA